MINVVKTFKLEPGVKVTQGDASKRNLYFSKDQKFNLNCSQNNSEEIA